jgi:hypothetical protein
MQRKERHAEKQWTEKASSSTKQSRRYQQMVDQQQKARNGTKQRRGADSRAMRSRKQNETVNTGARKQRRPELVSKRMQS